MRALISSLEGGLPHSEIHGSKGARPSPQLIAACHVLHRLSTPRHPPNALESLDRSSSIKAFMHGEDCAAILRSRHTRPSRVNALDDVKVHPMPQSAALARTDEPSIHDVNRRACARQKPEIRSQKPQVPTPISGKEFLSRAEAVTEAVLISGF
jgi:hypothetical protein